MPGTDPDDVKILGYRFGSVIVDYEVVLDDDADAAAVADELGAALTDAIAQDPAFFGAPVTAASVRVKPEPGAAATEEAPATPLIADGQIAYAGSPYAGETVAETPTN